jgi:hypothetical protein
VKGKNKPTNSTTQTNSTQTDCTVPLSDAKPTTNPLYNPTTAKPKNEPPKRKENKTTGKPLKKETKKN